MTIANSGGADRLLAVTAPGGAASIHSTSMTGGVMRMRALPDGLEIGERSTVTLAPMATHVMIEQLAQPLHPGEPIELRLKFERQGEVKVAATVAAPGMAH